jgi:molybdate transport system substrate-binding protein
MSAWRLCLLLVLLVGGANSRAQEAVAVAAAANLVHAVEALNAAFRTAEPAVKVTAAVGASGSLFAQIRHGAPFDVFLSADTEYPRQVVAVQAGDAGSLRVFAKGRLVLWTLRSDLDLADLAALVRNPAVKKIALAQPKVAPYGLAAQVALEVLGGWREAQPKLVVGESISQTAQFVETGNADVGFVALSIVRSSRLPAQGRWREIPAAEHPGVTLEHGVVLTTRGARNAAARRYLEFLGSEAGRRVLREFGYGVP